jgi:IS30 family transposase
MEKCNTTPGNYKHLSPSERDLIAVLLARGIVFREIGERLKRNKSTISREIKRNGSPVREEYRSFQAQGRYETRMKETHAKIRLKNDRIREYVIEKLKLKWSPEQIAGALQLKYPGLKTNYESIYQYIYKEAYPLREHLRRGNRIRKKRGGAKNKHQSKIPNRVMIDERPKEVALHIEMGHWEADTMVSRKSKAAIVVMVELVSGIVKLVKIPEKTAKNMSTAVNRSLCRMPAEMRKTITYDNGTENAMHEHTNKVLGVKSYFCHPYCSWEKPVVENTNGLVRQFLPKGTDFAKITKVELKAIEKLINNRPRKRHGYLTPLKVYDGFVALCA